MFAKKKSATAKNEAGGAQRARKPSSPASTETKLSRREQREKTKELARRKRELVAEQQAARKHAKRKRTKVQAAHGDDELWTRAMPARKRRAKAKDVYSAIGFDLMYEDGTCEAEARIFSQTIAFSDISYQASRVEDQKAFFSLYSQVFDYCGSETCLQLNVVNTPIAADEIGSKVFFDNDDPALAPYIDEYNKILNDKMGEGVSNLVRERYLTFSVESDSYVQARKPLARIRGDLAGAFTKLGCSVRMLDGAERLELIASQLRPGKPFSFDYKSLVTSGLTAKDSVCPSMLDLKPDGLDSCFRSDGKWCQVLTFKEFGSQLLDSALSKVIDLPIPLNVALHVQALDPGKGKDFVKGRLGWIDKDIIEYQQKAVRKGFDVGLLPQEISFSKNEAEEVLNELQYKNQRLFMFAGTVMTYADSFEQLQDQVVQIVRIARGSSIFIDELACQQRQGLNTCLPIGINHMEKFRYFTTAQVAMMLPFATQEINDKGGGYYGQNKVSSNLVMLNRRRLAAPMGFILGTPGSGKTFAAMREIFNNYISNPDAEFFIIDPKNEFPLFVEAMGGTNVPLSPTSGAHINLFDIYAGSADDAGANPATFKSETVIALAEEILGSGSNELRAEERTVIDRAVREVYADFEDSETAPTLGDFHAKLCSWDDPDARRLATAFEMYAVGSLSYFNHETTVDLDRRIVDFSFKSLGSQMRVFSMLIILDWVYNRMLFNYERGVTTWLYIDEVQELFGKPGIMQYFDTFWSIGRSLNLVPTGITQTVERIIEHKTAKLMLSNSDFLLLMKQSDRDRASLGDILGLSEQQKSYIDRSIDVGEGLLIAGGAIVPIKDSFPRGRLFDLWNTRPDEIAEKKRARWMERREQRGSAESGATPLSDLGVAKSTLARLVGAGIGSVEQLREMEAGDIGAVKGIGPVALRSIEDALARMDGVRPKQGTEAQHAG